MNITQIVIYSVIFLLLFNRASRVDAFILFFAFSVYQLFIIPLPDSADSDYYFCASLLNLCVGLCLHHRNELAAKCSYSLVFVSFMGLVIYHSELSPLIYDNICLIILTIQLAAIMPRNLFNGIRGYFKFLRVDSGAFDSSQPCVTIHQAKKTKAIKR